MLNQRNIKGETRESSWRYSLHFLPVSKFHWRDNVSLLEASFQEHCWLQNYFKVCALALSKTSSLYLPRLWGCFMEIFLFVTCIWLICWIPTMFDLFSKTYLCPLLRNNFKRYFYLKMNLRTNELAVILRLCHSFFFSWVWYWWEHLSEYKLLFSKKVLNISPWQLAKF